MQHAACHFIKEQIAGLHRQAGQTPFMQRLTNGHLDRREYVTYLRALSIIYSVMETELSRSTDPIISAVWREDMRKLPLLEQDISTLHDHTWVDLDEPMQAAMQGAELIRLHSLSNPWRILGCLYVLEGATNGGVLIYPRIQQAFNLQGETGTRFLRNYQAKQSHVWQEFRQRIDLTIQSGDAIIDAVAGAKEIFTDLIKILQGFDGTDTKAKVHATALNPEAGNHKVSQLEEEIQAVLSAAELSFSRFPYLQSRFGERGKKFTQSDGAWLATLPALPEPLVMQQVDWLARLLSAHGMPRIILESHLRLFENSLKKALPERAFKYAVLGRAAQRLASQRNEVIDVNIQSIAINRFHNKLVEWDTAKNLAQLLVSAKADEVIDGSSVLQDLLDWLDGSNDWPDSVKHAAHRLAAELAMI